MRSNRGLIKLVAAAAFCAFASAAGGTGQTASEQSYAGWIEEVRGPVYLKQNAEAEPILLHSSRDRFRRLYVGERVRCEHGGMLKLQLYGEITEIRESQTWFPIPQVSSQRSNLKQQALQSYGRIGGRERGDISMVYSPANGSSVRVADFVIGWIPRKDIATISIVIKDENDKEIWRQEGINAAAGQLISNEVRTALARYRDAGEQGPLILVLSDPGGGETRTSFSPLSAEDEQGLDRELGLWDKETNGLMRRVCRAYSFSSRQMLAETAAEYDAALELDPESHDLLVAAIEANLLTRNSARVAELTRRLAKNP